MKVCFVCSGANSTPFSEFIPLSIFLENNGVDTRFLLDEKAPDQLINSLKRENRLFYPEYASKNKQENLKKDVPKGSSKLSLLKKVIPFKHYISGFKHYKNSINSLKNYENIAFKYLSKEKPNCIILYGDRNLSIVPAAIKYAKRNNLPIMVLQVAVQVKSFLVHGRLKNIENSDSLLINKILKSKFPKQWIQEKGKSISYYSWYYTLALNKLNMLPENPWNDGDSWADKHLLISKQHLIDKKSEGSTKDNEVIVGQYSHDLLYKNFNEKENTKKILEKKYFDGSDKPFIIFGFPQFWEHNLMDKESAFKEIDCLVEAVTQFQEFNVLVSLHPKMNYEIYRKYEDSFNNLKIAKDERLSHILPCGSVFVTVFGSTISWASMCNVVPVHLDFYNFGFKGDNEVGCHILNDKERLNTDLAKVISNYLTHQKELMNKDRQNLPPFDGKSGERILREIKSLVNE